LSVGANTEQPILQVHQIEVGYSAASIVHDMSVACRRAQVTTIIGPNGCGKSTLLKAIIGFLRPRKGHVRLFDEDITGQPPQSVLRKGVSLVPQTRSIFPQMSVDENLLLGGTIESDRKLVLQRVTEVYAMFPRLAERKHRRAAMLSGGEQRLLELGRALILKPRILLLDEPSAMLAPSVLAELFAKIRAIADGGTAVLLVEQNIRKAFEISDMVYVLDYGTNFINGTPAQCAENPAVAELFLG
jgi:ABC-type branched-subunit amino acid transport system ATPase component